MEVHHAPTSRKKRTHYLSSRHVSLPSLVRKQNTQANARQTLQEPKDLHLSTG